jgi:hypothetical protein
VLSDVEGGFVDPQLHRLKGPYRAEVFPIEIEEDYLVISLTGLHGAVGGTRDAT